MTVSELTELLHQVPTGAAVTITSINVPRHTRGELYAILTIGHADYEQGCHDEDELRNAIKRFIP